MTRMIFDEFMELIALIGKEMDKPQLQHIGLDLSIFDGTVVFKVDAVEKKVESILGDVKGVEEQALFDAKFLSLRLPYPRMFLEWEQNPYPLKLTKDQIAAGARPIARVAAILLAHDTPEGYAIEGHIVYGSYSSIMGGSWDFEIELDEEGYLKAIRANYDSIEDNLILNDAEKQQMIFYRDLYTALMTISLLHCKNVETTQHEPHYTPKMARRGERKGTSYKTLTIRPMRQAARSGGHEGGTGGKRRLHLVRGHFKEFTDDAPLFGKYTGRYWWEAQARGDQNEGVVIKDYDVKPQ